MDADTYLRKLMAMHQEEPCESCGVRPAEMLTDSDPALYVCPECFSALSHQ